MLPRRLATESRVPGLSCNVSHFDKTLTGNTKYIYGIIPMTFITIVNINIVLTINIAVFIQFVQ